MSEDRSKLQFNSDLATARQRFETRQYGPAYASELVSSHRHGFLLLGSLKVWAWIWGMTVSAALIFSAWQASHAADVKAEFIEWVFALAVSLGLSQLALMAGGMIGASFIKYGQVFFGIAAIALVGFGGSMLSSSLKPIWSTQWPGVVAKEQTIWAAIRSMDLRQQGSAR